MKPEQRMPSLFLAMSAETPLYVQLCSQLRLQILSGDLLPGSRLPSIRRLAVDLHISVITVKRSYDELEKEGYVIPREGRGVFVAEQGSELREEQRRRLVETHLSKAVDEARRLGIPGVELKEMLSLMVEEDL